MKRTFLLFALVLVSFTESSNAQSITLGLKAGPAFTKAVIIGAGKSKTRFSNANMVYGAWLDFSNGKTSAIRVGLDFLNRSSPDDGNAYLDNPLNFVISRQIKKTNFCLVPALFCA